jgi:ABC-2 type transport system permease protein
VIKILAIVGKDIKQITRNRFLAVITFLSIFVFALVYYLLPAHVEEQLKVGLFLERGRPAIEEQLKDEKGLKVTWADSPAEVRKLVTEGKVHSKPVVKQYVSSETPLEVRESGRVIGREFALSLTGGRLPVNIDEVIIGPDLMGRQVPLRNELRVLFVVMVLLVELYTLSNLLVDEIRLRTIKALLVTPVSVGDFMAAKSITGISLAFSEGVLIALLVRVLTLDTLLAVLILLFLGAILVTGLAFLVGALSRDIFSIIAWGTMLFIVLALPAITLILPGATSPYIAVIPTDSLIVAMNGVVNQGIALRRFAPEIIYLILYDAVLFTAGFFVLRKRLT